ncbi:MAG TPA: hypothetical protein VG797_05465 [Phycisphaerales bacterium]|nr:hypothetical protein [Phycisphaerales bacterium]
MTDRAESSLDDRGVRVVLVGRTGLDSTLRRDPGIELQRAKTYLDAIGEAANPIDEHSPTACAVIVAPDTIPDQETDSFVDSIRRVAPRARIFSIGETPISSRFHGAIDRQADGLAVRRAMLKRPPREPEAAVTAPAAIEAPPPEAMREAAREPAAMRPTSPLPPTPVHFEDGAILSALLTGGDVRAAAMEIVQRAAPAARIEFVAKGREQSHTTAHSMVAEVRHGAAVFGTLIAHGAGEELKEYAAWLALWLAAAAQRDHLRTAAFSDPASGAWNRNYYDRFVAQAATAARGRRSSVSVVLISLAPESAAPARLHGMVRQLNQRVRGTDRVCRVGNCEIAVVLDEPMGPRRSGSRPVESASFISRLAAPGSESGTIGPIRCGMATFPWDASEPGELLAKARLKLGEP